MSLENGVPFEKADSKRSWKKRKSIGQIADELEEEVTAIQRIIEEIQKEE